MNAKNAKIAKTIREKEIFAAFVAFAFYRGAP